jgi:hypothetical protein
MADAAGGQPKMYGIDAVHMGKFLDAVEQHGRENVTFWLAPKGFSKDGPRPAWDVEIEGIATQVHEEGHEGENFVKICPPDCPGD